MNKGLLVIFFFFFGFVAKAREATFNWEPIPSAQKYDVQIAQDPEFKKMVFQKEVSETELTTSLPTGTFYYRVRALRPDHPPGYWSRAVIFSVHGYAPELKDPKDDAFYNYYEIPPKITFDWHSPDSSKNFELLITRASGEKALEKRVDGESLTSDTLGEGEYTWRVRALEPSGGVGPFSDVRHFRIEKLPIQKPELLTPEKDDRRAAYRPAEFTWKSDPVAPYSDLEIRRADSHRVVYSAKNLTGKSWGSPDLEEGDYEWTVTSKEGPNTPGVASSPRKLFVQSDVIASGDYYLRAGVALRSFNTQSSTTRYSATRVDHTANALVLVPEFSGSYFPMKGLGFGLDAESGQSQIEGANVPWDRTTLSLRFRFGQPGSDQQFYLGYRDQLLTEIHPDFSPVSSTLDVHGIVTGLMLNGTLTRHWRLHLDFNYFKPTGSAQDASNLTGDFGEASAGITYQLHSRLWIYSGVDYRIEVYQFQNANSPPASQSTVQNRILEPLMRLQYEY